MRNYYHFMQWLKKKDPERFDFYTTKKRIEETLKFYKTLDVWIYTRRKKWEEINNKKKLPDKLQAIKDKIYTSTTTIPKPKIILCDNKERKEDWNILRRYQSSMYYSSQPAKELKYLVIDEDTKQYIGFFRLSSELFFFGSYLPITRQQLFRKGQHIVNLSVIHPTQPFGYNMLGGKLISLLSISKQVCEDWERIHQVKPVIMTTTSLYGTFSQYSSLNEWKSAKQQKSNMNLALPPEEYKLLKNFFYWYNPRIIYNYFVDNVSKRNIKNRFLEKAYATLRINKNISKINYYRGRYYCKLYYNSIEYLQERLTDDELKTRIDNRQETLVNKWRPKAEKRLDKLTKENRLKIDIDFNDWMHNKKWNNVYEYLYQNR